MASPLSTLRKYQFAFFVFFGVLLMIVFVIGDPLDSWLRARSGSGRAAKEVVVTWRGGELTEGELRYEQGVRNVVREFISALLEETQKRKGFPRVQMLTLSPSERAISYTHILASKAEEMGLVATDETVLQYLEKLSADLISQNEIGDIFRRTVGDRISEQQAINTIKAELLAQNYLAMTYPDLTRGQLPAQAWHYFQRLNRRVKAEVVPLKVADFTSQVTQQPTDAEVAALYEEGKNRFPDPFSPEPGFMRRPEAAFEFVRADRKKFEEAEFAKLRPQVTDQEITEYYEKNRDEFRVTAAPAATPPVENPGATAPPKDAPPAETTAPPATGDAKPKEEKPAGDKTDSDKPAANDKPADEKETAPAAESKPEEGKEAVTPPPEGKPESNDSDEAASDANPEDELDTEDACGSVEEEPASEQAESPTTNQPSAAEKPAAETSTSEPAPEAKPAEAPAADAKPAEAPAADAKPTKDASPGAEPPATAPAAPAGEEKTGEGKPATTTLAEPAPEYKPLDDALRKEIGDKIARQKATRAAQERVDQGFDEIRRAVEKHAREVRNAELGTGKNAPAPLDLEKLAEKHEMEVGQIPLSDPLEVEQYELGKTFDFDFSSMSFQRIPFNALAYREGLSKYRPAEIRGENFEVHFLYWKTSEEASFVPPLDKVRDEVVNAWKHKQAVNLAQAEAKALAERARESKQPLKEVVAEKKLTATETNEFSWLTTGLVPAGMGMPALSSVDGVEQPGNDFMEAVFALEPDQVGTATNQPHSIVYVVEVLSQSPSDDLLREMFLESGLSREMQQVAAMDRAELDEKWREMLESDMNIEWVREPQT